MAVFVVVVFPPLLPFPLILLVCFVILGLTKLLVGAVFWRTPEILVFVSHNEVMVGHC